MTATKTELRKQGTLVHFLEESGPKGVETSNTAPNTRSVGESKVSAFIGG